MNIPSRPPRIKLRQILLQKTHHILISPEPISQLRSSSRIRLRAREPRSKPGIRHLHHRNISLEPSTTHTSPTHGIIRQSQGTEISIELLADLHKLLRVGIGLRAGICFEVEPGDGSQHGAEGMQAVDGLGV